MSDVAELVSHVVWRECLFALCLVFAKTWSNMANSTRRETAESRKYTIASESYQYWKIQNVLAKQLLA